MPNDLPGPGGWHTIVIGSGMGGMTAAAMLAKLGHRVLVLEQHYVAGGFTHEFKRPGYRWDVGVHAVGEVTEHSMPGRLLSRLTDARLTWASLGPVYDAFEFPDGISIDFPDDRQVFRENLITAFPAEVDGIDRYLARVREVAGAMRGYYLGRLFPAAVVWSSVFLRGRLVARCSSGPRRCSIRSPEMSASRLCSPLNGATTERHRAARPLRSRRW